MGPAIAIKAQDKVEKLPFVRSDRIAKLRELVQPAQPELDPERLRYWTLSYKETEGQITIIRRAKALEKMLSEMTIYILDGELIVGNQTRSPQAAAIPCEYGAEWIERDLDSFGTRDQDRFVSTEDEKAEIRELLAYWIGKSVDARIGQRGEAMAKAFGMDFMSGSAFMGFGHVTADYGKMISKGVKGIKEEIADNVKKLDPWKNPDDILKYETYEAMNIALDAFVKYAHRYAEFARDLASKEKDANRKHELERIASNCEWVPENPARTFWEALQTVWFVQVALLIEGMGYAYAPGRMDQYLYPYYRKDIDEGIMSNEWAHELLEACYCKFNETTVLLASSAGEGGEFNHPSGMAGQPVTQNIIIGGQTADGKDASNELSHLLIDVDMSVRLRQPELTVRLHKGTPDEFLRHTAELVRTGLGRPKFFVDETSYRMYDRWAETGGLEVSKEDLWDYCPAGCVESVISSKTACYGHASGATLDYGAYQINSMLLLVLHQGKAPMFGDKLIGAATPDPRTFTSFDQVMEAYKQQCYATGMWSILTRMVEDEAMLELAPTPFQSTLISDCIGKGLDATRGGARYNTSQGAGMGNTVGMVNEANGLAVIKKLVFDDKVISMDDLINAIDNNWQDFEDMRLMVVNRAPKFGNDDDYVDSIMNELMELSGSEAGKYRTATRRAVFGSAVESVSVNVMLGGMLQATPDGRFAGTPVNDGGVSPHLGTDKNGPTAILNSVCKLDHAASPQGTLWNLKFTKQALEGERGLNNLVDYLRSFIDKGGYHVQINCLDNKTLKDAQVHPEDHRNLVIRVAGYSAFFTDIEKDVQDMLIARTENSF